jgi:hypothetical protein
MESSQIKFNGGVWSDVLKGRLDLGNYQSSARTCENFIPTRYGQIEKRSGTKQLGYAKYDDKKCVLHSFQYSVDTKFILEFGHEYVRFWSNDLQVEDPNNLGSALEVSTDYQEGDLYELQMRAINDVLYIVHPEYPVSKLTRFADNDWRFTTASLKQPFVNPDVDGSVQVEPSGTNGNITITSTADTFSSDYVGSDLKLEYLLEGRSYIFHDRYTHYATDYTQEINGRPATSLDNVTPFSKTQSYSPDPVASGFPWRVSRNADLNGQRYHYTCKNEYLPVSWGGYALGSNIEYQGTYYTCTVAHQPTTFAADLAAGKWQVYGIYPWSDGSNLPNYVWVPVGAVVSYLGNIYICVIHHLLNHGIRPTTTGYWAPLTLPQWTTGKSEYRVNEVVIFNNLTYACVQDHTRGATFADDLALGYWVEGTHPEDFPNHFSQGAEVVFPQIVVGKWSVKTTGNWQGDWAIQRSVDNGRSWSTIRTLSSRDDANYLAEEDQEGDEALIRILAITTYWSAWEQEEVTFSILSAPTYGTATVTGYTSPTEVTATVTKSMPSTDKAITWTESAFSPRQGFPRAIDLMDSRLVLAGTKKKPQGFFYSAIADYDDFTAKTTLADAPFFVEAISDDQSAVQWLSAQRELFVGTASVEGVLTSRKQDEGQSAENLPIVRWNESMGSAHRAALPIRDSVMILQRGMTTINMLSYSLEADGYTGEEVTLLCPHLFESGVLQMTHMREPYTGAFTVNNDGTVCHMVYEPKLQVTGWCKYTTHCGTFESIQTLPSEKDEDNVWVSVKRTIDGVTKRHIERFVTGNTKAQQAKSRDEMWYADCAVHFEGTNLTQLTGLDHLEGESVCASADGVKSSHTVSSGSITLSTPASKVVVGLPITSTFEPMDIEAQGTMGKRKQLFQTKLLVWRSLGGSVSSDGKDYIPIVYHKAGDNMDSAVPLRDGYLEIFHESNYGRQKFWRIQHDEPYPFTLQTVIQSFTVSKK